MHVSHSYCHTDPSVFITVLFRSSVCTHALRHSHVSSSAILVSAASSWKQKYVTKKPAVRVCSRAGSFAYLVAKQTHDLVQTLHGPLHRSELTACRARCVQTGALRALSVRSPDQPNVLQKTLLDTVPITRCRVRLDQNRCKTRVAWTDEWIGRGPDCKKTTKAGVEGLDGYLENRVHSRVALTYVQVWRVRETGVGRTGGQRTRVHETAIDEQTCLGSA